MPPPELTAGLARQTVEFLISLGLCLLLFRTFAAEAYVVPTGSMAPTLFGVHREIPCPNCGTVVGVGMDERGRCGRPVCPNCGQEGTDESAGAVGNGDRLLVQKFFFDFRPPRRWEVAVFQSPNEPNQAYVKRVVGLPGELVRILDGDVWIDGAIARKPLEVQRAMRIPVFDADLMPRDADRFPRVVFRRGGYRIPVESGWSRDGGRFVHRPKDGPAEAIDWLDYRHWDPDAGRYGPVRDFCAYNGGDVRADNLVKDLMFEAEIRVGPDVKEVVARVNRGGDSWMIRLPVDRPGEVRVQRDGRSLTLDAPRGGLRSSTAEAPRPQRLEVSLFDRSLIVAVDGELLFAPYDFAEEDHGPGPFATPIGIGLDGGHAEVSGFRVFRDVHYTHSLWNPARRTFGVDAPYSLGPGEYYVLGDNSPVSNDSRFWPTSPVVKASAFVGKPFLVHLPGRMFLVEVFGRSLCRIPDPREIRYIR